MLFRLIFLMLLYLLGLLLLHDGVHSELNNTTYPKILPVVQTDDPKQHELLLEEGW